MKKKQNLGDRLTEIGSKYVDVLTEASNAIGNDVKKVVSLGEEKLQGLIDTAFNEDYQKDIGNTIFKYAKKGKKEVERTLKKKVKKYNARMDELAQTDPKAAGFLDGVLNAYIATPCDRRPRSQMYKTHAKYGKVFGFVSSIVVFSPTKLYRFALGVSPVLSRTVKYLNSKVAEASETVKSKK